MQTPPVGQRKPKLVIVGCGTVGTAMAKLLSDSGYQISGVVTSRLETARTSAEATGADHYSERPWELTLGGEVVFITTPDDMIAPVCREIAEHEGFRENMVVLHCSGALSSEILEPARDSGASVATLHPLQSFASIDQAIRLVPDSFCAVEGEEKALPIVRQIVEDIGGILLEITSENKTLYHAAAVVASNYLVTLMGLAIELNKSAGLATDESFSALLPLIKGTLSNVRLKGIPDALTGPIARGDVATLTAHLEAMERDVPEYLSLYRCLGLFTVEIAKEKGSISQETAVKLVELLRPSP
jgi:predicted short-subunit dehydrogenase-like oxidoreductase (DUF2520 family)